MIENDALKLKKGQKVIHNSYGVCEVKEVVRDESCGELFGVVITPLTENGRALLRLDTGTDITDFLEDSVRRIALAEDVIPGAKPIELETAWGISEEDMPEPEPKNHFAPHDEEVSR